MDARMRAFDWGPTPLGEPARWPTALRTTLRLLLSSNHPMFIWWGPELIQFYNDAYRATMDAQRHPAALGQRAGSPSGVGPQSKARMRAPISPPPDRKAACVDIGLSQSAGSMASSGH